MENWERIKAVQRMQDCIEDHLTEPVTLRMLARAALQLRKDGNARIVDVALDFVFDSHEGFTRAFSRHFGMSPRHYAKNRPPVPIFMPARIRDYYLNLQKGEKTMTEKTASTVFVQVVDRPARKLILKRGTKATHYFEYCDEVGCDIWNVLTGIKDALYEPIGMWLPENLRRPGTSVYAQGVEMPADYSGDVPEGLEIIDLPPCKMMVFQGQPFDDEKFGEAIGDLWEVMKNYNPDLYGFAWADEDGPRFQLEPQGYRGYIEGRPVRELNK